MSAATLNKNPQTEWLDIVAKQVDSVRFGIVQIVIHEGRVVQVERTEKVRLDQLSQRDANSQR